MRNITEYDVQSINQYGKGRAYVEPFGGPLGKRQAMEYAMRQVANGRTIAVVRVIMSRRPVWGHDGFSLQEVDHRFTTVWTGGKREWLEAGGWHLSDKEIVAGVNA